MNLEEEIRAIQTRNKNVEIEKAREVSVERKVLIALFTYCIVVLFFLIIQSPKPFLGALVPTGGFLLSTLSLDFFKKKRMQKHS